MILKNKLVLLLFALIVFTFLLVFYLNRKPSNKPKYLEESDPFQFGNLFNSIPQKLINIPFRYILNNKNICESQTEEILAVFIVTSYFGNIETRSSMRRAFSTEDLRKYNLRRVFLLGEASQDKFTTQQSISNENKRFEDIIQGNFSEAYRNLTYKHVMGLKWASSFCVNAKYIIKMDDDIVINMYKLKFIINSLQKLKKDFIAGYVLRNLNPIRDPANKWYVTEEEYSLRSYPSFISGWFYVTSLQTVRKIAALSDYEKYFWIDDVFVTGILAKKLEIIQYDISKYFTVNSEFLQCCLQDFKKNIVCDISIGPNGGDSNMFFAFNENIKKCIVKKCTKRSKPLNETCVAERKTNLGRGNVIINDFRLI